jgi:hypothetical protein
MAMVAKSTDKRDTRDAEQIGAAIKQLRKTGMTACEAADYVNGVTMAPKPKSTNGNHK